MGILHDIEIKLHDTINILTYTVDKLKKLENLNLVYFYRFLFCLFKKNIIHILVLYYNLRYWF